MGSELIGRFVISRAGHDKGSKYVIIYADERFVYLCDGKYHSVDKLKKKAYKHVEICVEGLEPLLQKRLINKEEVFDYEIKYAIKKQQ